MTANSTREIVFRCFAKLNLSLEVLGRREDGFHELCTVFQTVDLHDLLGVELGGDGVRLEVRRGDVPTGADNIVVKAASRYLERWAPGQGVGLWLDKRIPVGGGLGGGSSDAAGVLSALQLLLRNPASAGDLLQLAREIGADVPYFLCGGTALGEGRGDEITPLPELGSTELALITPPIEVSTAEIFAVVDEVTRGTGVLTPGSTASSILAATRLRGEGRVRLEDVAGINDLAPVVFDRVPEVGRLYNLLSEAGAAPVCLSGTGASLFARFKTTEIVDGLKMELPKGTGCVGVRTLSRGEIAAIRNVRGER